MRISFVLNGDPVSIDARAETLLVDILRKEFGLTGARPGCLQGECGICSILLGGELSLACMIPAFRVQDCEVTTIEGVMQSREFRDIEYGFHRAGMEPCRFCAAAKVLVTHALIRSTPTPGTEALTSAASAIHCRCTSYSRFTEGIRFAAEARRKRYNVRQR